MIEGKFASFILALAVVQPASAQFDTALAFGDAASDQGIDGIGDRENGRTSGTLLSPTAGVFEITSGGADFWGASDAGTVIYDASGGLTTTGDFTATVRHVGVNIDSARDWGRGVLTARRTEGNATPGIPEPDDARFGIFRRSNAATQVGTVRRPGDGALTYRATTLGSEDEDLESDRNDRLQFVGREDQDNPVFLSIGRSGKRWWTAYAADLDGNGNPGRSIVHYALDAGTDAMGLVLEDGIFDPITGDNDTRDNVGIALGEEVTIVLGHQAHNAPQQLEGPDLASGGNRVNTATFDNFSFQNTFDLETFGVPPNQFNWEIDGSIEVVDGEVIGSAFVRDYINNDGSATGENIGWEIRAARPSQYFVPIPGEAGSRRDPTQMEPTDLVPPGNFRLDADSAPGTGLHADLYVDQPNGATSEANLGYIANNTPTGSLTVSRVVWNNSSDRGYYKTSATSGGFYDAVGGTHFGDNENNYGVDLRGEIFIPPNGGKIDAIEAVTGLEYILFEEGVDDYVYLEVDGQVLNDDNDFTNENSVINGGGNIMLMDVSDPKFDDGEWVSFRMVVWEGSSSDNAALYWDANDDNNTFQAEQTPGTFSAPVIASGVNQVGTDLTSGSFGVTLGGGDWVLQLVLRNTQIERDFVIGASVGGVPEEDTTITDFSYSPENQTVDLTWASIDDAMTSYEIQASSTLQINDWEPLESNIPTDGTFTTLNDITIPATLRGPRLFFRVRRE